MFKSIVYDNLHRVYLSCDLLILDELETTCDSNLKDEIINHFLTKKEKTDERNKKEYKIPTVRLVLLQQDFIFVKKFLLILSKLL